MVTECLPLLERQPLLATAAAAGHGPGPGSGLGPGPGHAGNSPVRREDPMSHRIIEKRRRDRMNNCLADLSRLIPAEYLKKGRGRVEKTEIIEMAIKHMQYLQTRATLSAGAGIECELRVTKCEQSPESDREQGGATAELVCTPPPGDTLIRPVVRPIVTEHYRLGYQECLSEAMHFLVEVEGYFAGDSLCVKLISHLQKHCDKIVKGDRLNFPRSRRPGEASSSSGSSSSCQGGVSKPPSGAATPWMGSAEEVGPASQLREILCASPPGQCGPELPLPAHHAYLSPRARPMASHTPPLPPPQHPLAQPQHLQQHPLAQPQHLQQQPLPQQPQPSPPQQPTPQHFEGAHHMDSPRHTSAGPLLHHHHHHHMDHSHEDHLHQHHHSYKFKNTIKQRFTEEHGNANHSHPHTPTPSHGMKRRRTTTRSPSPSSSQPTSSQHFGVPIFVLHAKGSFYIPLTVSCEVLAPYMDTDLLSDVLSSSAGPTSASSIVQSSVVLHPVTISVNFQQYVKPQQPSAAAPSQTSVSVPPQSSTLASSCSPHSWPRSDGYHVSPWDP